MRIQSYLGDVLVTPPSKERCIHNNRDGASTASSAKAVFISHSVTLLFVRRKGAKCGSKGTPSKAWTRTGSASFQNELSVILTSFRRIYDCGTELVSFVYQRWASFAVSGAISESLLSNTWDSIIWGKLWYPSLPKYSMQRQLFSIKIVRIIYQEPFH